MDSMLQRHCARYIYVIPDGLRELMSDISREVLRSQPEDVYTFIADYLDALLITRENARVAARLVESLTEMAITTATLLEQTGMERDQIESVVSAVQKTFKKSLDSDQDTEQTCQDVENEVITDILNEIEVSSEQANIAAIIIQQAYKRFKERKEREKEILAGMVDWRVAARSAIYLYRKSGVTNEEANRAATLIKAAYKGYYTRKVMKNIASQAQGSIVEYLLNDSPESEDEEDLEEGEHGGDDYAVSDKKSKSVTIDFQTVIPHVDFNTDASKSTLSAGSSQISTASRVAKHQLRHIFNAAVERINKEPIIIEESTEESVDASVAASVDVQEPVEIEIKHEHLDVMGIEDVEEEGLKIKSEAGSVTEASEEPAAMPLVDDQGE